MIRRPPRSPLTDTRFPYRTRFRSPKFPGARPLLQRLLPLNRVGNLIVKFDIHEPRDAIPFDEARPETLSVLPDAARDVIGDANVERPMLAVGKDVNAVGHRLAPMPMGPGDKPRDEIGRASCRERGGHYV